MSSMPDPREAGASQPACSESAGPPPKRKEEAAPPRIEASLLEEVLRHTVEELAGSEPLEPADVEALRAVARRHAGQPLALRPVAVELVEAMLRRQLPGEGDAARLRQLVSDQVARTLLDDPTTRERLEALWAELGSRQP